MFLAVDIGNSHTSFGLFTHRQLNQHWRIETHAGRTADELASIILPLLKHAGVGQENWQGIAVCSVVPPVDAAVSEFCTSYLKQKPFKIHGGLNLGFTVNVETPREVGADRLANTAYAVEKLRLPAIIVDFGTAITFDVISEERAYEGGVILPGVRVAFETLSKNTSQLPLVDLEFPDRVIGKNTVSCIQSGILIGYCDLIKGLLNRTIREIGVVNDIVLTGGYSTFFHPHIGLETQLLPHLTLEGIEILFRRCSKL